MLTELAIKNAKTRATSYMIRDQRGLYLRIDSSGAKYWIFRYYNHAEYMPERIKIMQWWADYLDRLCE